MRTKHTFRLPPDLAGKLADYANRKGVTQALVVEAALASHLSPDGADRLEAVGRFISLGFRLKASGSGSRRGWGDLNGLVGAAVMSNTATVAR